MIELLNDADHYTSVIEQNERRLSAYYGPISDILDNVGVGQSPVAVVAVGSDGKLERHPQSQTELILLKQATVPSIKAQFTSLAQSPSNIFRNELMYARDGQTFEYDVDGPTPLCRVYGNPNAQYPDNLLNSSFVAGSPDVYYQMRRRLLIEMTTQDSLGKSIRDDMKEQLSAYRRCLRSGVYRQAQVIDPYKGIQYYHEDPNHKTTALGLKMPFLRTIQRKLDLITTQAIQKGLIDLNDVAVNCPTNTADRIRYLQDRRILSPDTDSIIEAYQWALRHYHNAQETYRTQQKPIEVYFDPTVYFNFVDQVEAFSLIQL